MPVTRRGSATRRAVRVAPSPFSGALQVTRHARDLLAVPDRPRDAVALVRLLRRARYPGGETSVRVRALQGAPLIARHGTDDIWALFDTFRGRYHLPPPAVRIGEVRRVWDLGANIGTTMAHYCAIWPEASVLGVELDPENAALCRRNLAMWPGATLIEGAVWHEPGEVRWGTADGQGALSGRVGGSAAHTAPSVTLDSLAAALPDGTDVDFVKMDIEGAEREVLRHNTGWASRVRSMKVEIHAPYRLGEAIGDLRALGFVAEVDASHAAAVACWREARTG